MILAGEKNNSSKKIVCKESNSFTPIKFGRSNNTASNVIKILIGDKNNKAKEVYSIPLYDYRGEFSYHTNIDQDNLASYCGSVDSFSDLPYLKHYLDAFGDAIGENNEIIAEYNEYNNALCFNNFSIKLNFMDTYSIKIPIKPITLKKGWYCFKIYNIWSSYEYIINDIILHSSNAIFEITEDTLLDTIYITYCHDDWENSDFPKTITINGSYQTFGKISNLTINDILSNNTSSPNIGDIYTVNDDDGSNKTYKYRDLNGSKSWGELTKEYHDIGAVEVIAKYSMYQNGNPELSHKLVDTLIFNQLYDSPNGYIINLYKSNYRLQESYNHINRYIPFIKNIKFIHKADLGYNYLLSNLTSSNTYDLLEHVILDKHIIYLKNSFTGTPNLKSVFINNNTMILGNLNFTSHYDGCIILWNKNNDRIYYNYKNLISTESPVLLVYQCIENTIYYSNGLIEINSNGDKTIKSSDYMSMYNTKNEINDIIG